jgi:hypothetical protein
MPVQPGLYRRKPLNEITAVPDSIISVYVVENHIWAEGGTKAARAARRVERRTIEEFLIQPVRPFLRDILRQVAAPYTPGRKDNPIGQGYWIQAEFGSGKSHLLSFLGALALGGEAEWKIIQEKEAQAGVERRDSLYRFWEEGLARKAQKSRGIFVAVQTLVGQGGGAVGVGGAGKTLTEYVLDAVAEQFYLENGRSLPLYPAEMLAERFLKTDDFERYRRDLAKFLKDPTYFDEEKQQELAVFLDDLRSNADPGVQRDCGQTLWDFYDRYLKIRPQIPLETEAVLKQMVERLLAEGYAGLLLILDEVSLFMKGRSEGQRIEDEKALVVLSNRLAKVECLPVWTVCAAQQAIETKMPGIKNILARERLDPIALLNTRDAYYDIALARVRTITEPAAVDQYYEDYKRSFSWPAAVGRDQFARFFPFYPPSLEVVRAVSMNLTTVRSALYFMLETLRRQRKAESCELITHWTLFDDVVDYEEDPSGTGRSITSLKTRWPAEWRAYETAIHQLDTVTKGPLKLYRGRAAKIVRTLFLYHVADMAPNGLGHEELLNAVMEWRDHDREQAADLQDNLDHYETLADKIATELAQVARVGKAYRFNPTGGIKDPREHFQRARSEAEVNEVQCRQAWDALLALDGWQVQTRLMSLDLAGGLRSIFRDIAPQSQTDLAVKWHGRLVTGRVYMRDLLHEARRGGLLPSINSDQTGLDFAVFVSSTLVAGELDKLIEVKRDGRVLFWSPDELTPSERALLADFTAYRALVADFSGRDTQEAKEVLEWVQGRLRAEMGSIYRMVPDAYGRGRIAALDHAQMAFQTQGELAALLTPLVGQVLDSAYVSKELDFEAAPAPFDDTNAVNVINGIVKAGEFPRGVKPSKEISASQNYGFALRIMRRPNDRKLDTSDCRYTADLARWIEARLGDSTGTLPAAAIYKNFMGVGGPDGVNYGLSRRMVQLYLLCLAREGKIRISLTGRNLPAEAVDYSNIAGLDFKAAVLDGFDQIQRLQPPEGWELLAPYAAALLGDPAIAAAREDAEIQAALTRVLAYRQENAEPFRRLRAGLADLFAEIGVLRTGIEASAGFPGQQERPANPKGGFRTASIPENDLVSTLLDRLAAWEKFLAAPVGPIDNWPYILNALDDAFGYHVYRDDAVSQAETDDLAARRAETLQAERLYDYRDQLRAAARYAAVGPVANWPYDKVRAGLGRLPELMTNETRLAMELLDPAAEAIASYTVRYLQAFDHVTSRTEQAREQIAALPDTPVYQALSRLAALPQLGADPRPDLQARYRAMIDGPDLFPAGVTRAAAERELRERPDSPGCPLTLENAEGWLERAENGVRICRDLTRAALMEKARLLHSAALRERLTQGAGEPFIAGLLAAGTAEAVAGYLEHEVTKVHEGHEARRREEGDPVALLVRYLKKLRVRKVRLADFRPGKRTIERGDVDAVVAEFRRFLLEGLAAGEDELPVVELE